MNIPTTWSTNPDADANRYPYDSGSITFDSGSRTFDGVTVGESSYTTAIPLNWTNTTNQSAGTNWLTNPAAYASTDNYDTTGIYDTADNYDAIVPGQSFYTTKQPITWTEV